MSRSIGRRDFLRVSSAVAAGGLLAACVPTTTPGTAPTTVAETPAPGAAGEPTAEASRYREAPMLAKQVAQGTLPPVEDRLPSDPLVMPVVEEIGQYGGIWHRCAVGINDASLTHDRLGGPYFFMWLADASGLRPNIAAAYEYNEDATECTVRLRPGTKWSDGEPFTADDVLFWYEDVLQNEQLTPTTPDWFMDGEFGEPGIVEKVDDYTVLFRFQSPYGLWAEVLTSRGSDICRHPKHYLTQFHPSYADADELRAKIEAASFANWWELYGDRRSWTNVEYPTMATWVQTRVPPQVPVLHTRNPYFYAVDPEGNQLPYIDQVQFEVVENADLLNLKAVAGEIDCQFRHILWSNYPLFIENAEQGDYRVFQWALAEGSNTVLMPNYSHPDEVLRDLYRNRDFRIALSHGINRTDINELTYQGFGVPRQASVIAASPYFKPEYATAYADYDPDLANELLDGLGLTERNADGFRLRPDGQPLTVIIEYAPVFGPWRDVINIVATQWKDIGINVVPQEEDRTLYYARAQERDMGVWVMDRCGTPLIQPIWFMPWAGGQDVAHQWWLWYTSRGESGEEPTPDVKRQYELYDLIKTAAPEDLPALSEEFFDNASREVWYIGTVGELPAVGVVKNNFRNVPEEAVSDVLQMTPNNTDPAQCFFGQA